MMSALTPSRRFAATGRANHFGHQDTGLVGSRFESLARLDRPRHVTGVFQRVEQGNAGHLLALSGVGRPVLAQELRRRIERARHDVGNGAVGTERNPDRFVEWLGPIHGSVVHGGIEPQIVGRDAALQLGKLTRADVVVFAGNQHAGFHPSIRVTPGRYDDTLLMGADCSGLRCKPRSVVRHNATSLKHNAIQRRSRVSVAGRAA